MDALVFASIWPYFQGSNAEYLSIGFDHDKVAVMQTSMKPIPQHKEVREVLKHIDALDGVRGLAIILVLLNHLLSSNPQGATRFVQIILKVSRAGWVGVDLFFALSGFLITGILFDSLHDPHYLKNFYVRRVLRIFPLYYGVILLLFLLYHSSSVEEKRPLYLLLVYLQNTPVWWHHAKGVLVDPVNHLWSLAVEEQFYLVWPCVIYWVRDRKKLIWVAIGLSLGALLVRAFLLAHGASFEDTYKMTICRLDSLLAGAWLALIVRGKFREIALRYAPFFFWTTIIMCGLIAWRTGNFDWRNNYSINLFGYSIIAITCTSFIAMALRPLPVVSRALNGKVLRFFGKYSYGIYVYHQLVGITLSWKTVIFLHIYFHSKVFIHLASMLVIAGVTIPLAILSFHLYEKHFLDMKRYFNYSTRQPLAKKSIPGHGTKPEDQFA